MVRLRQKFRAVLYRILLGFSWLPARIIRLLLHLLYPLLKWNKSIAQYRLIDSFLDWCIMIFFYLLDLFTIPEIYEILMEITFITSRDLTKHEKRVAKTIFGDNIELQFVRMNSKNQLARSLKIAYVSFNHINYFTSIPDQILVHELVHVWQYQHFGSVYIYKALKAQNSEKGYNYGSVITLAEIQLENGNILNFNFEQQGDIFQDYYLQTLNQKDSNLELAVYKYYVDGIKDLV